MSRTVNIRTLAKAIADTQKGMPMRTAGKKYGITRKTIAKYIKELDPTSTLALLIQKELRQQEQSWAQDIEPAIKEGIKYLMKAYNSLDPTDPNAVAIVTASIEKLSELAMTRKILQARMHEDHEIGTSRDNLAEARGEGRGGSK